MDHFELSNGVLHAEDVALADELQDDVELGVEDTTGNIWPIEGRLTVQQLA